MKERFQKILELLGLVNTAKTNGKLTDEEWGKVVEAYNKQFNSDFYADMANDTATVQKAAAHDKALELIQKAGAPEGGAADPEETNTNPDLVAQVSSLAEENNTLKNQVKDLNQKVEKLGNSTEPDDPKKVKLGIIGGGLAMRHTATHAFGIEHKLFDANKRWNKITMKGAAVDGEPDQELEESFRKEVHSYGKSVAIRMQELNRLGLLTPEALNPKSDLVSYGDLADAGLGEQYVVRRQDALIARILEVPNVKGIFPLRYGVQDKELITNAFLGEFSQGYQEGEVFKGSVSLQPEMGYVDDAMIKTKFQSLKWIERQYIGYLNTNGSDPIKWNMIEWLVLNIGIKATQEQNERNVMGVYRKPTATEAGHYLHAGNGVIHTLLRYYRENKVLPFGSDFEDYDSTTMLSVVEAFVEETKLHVTTLSDKALYLNLNHRKWYANGYRTKYGTDGDFGGVNLDQVQDEELKIIWVPNMGQMKLMWVTMPGNLQLLENLPGEMLKLSFQQNLEAVMAWSVWKEGASAAFAGERFATRALMVTNNYHGQVIFMNWPSVTLADDATTCDGTAGILFKSRANTTAAQAITDITGAEAGKAYIIEIGSATNPQKVTKADKFSTITANWTPTHLGDYLMVVYDAANSKFLEMERCVGGTRSINATYVPNMTT